MYQRNEEIKRLPRHFRAKCVTQCQKSMSEAKVLGLSAGQRPKANNQQDKRMVAKEKMDCFDLVIDESRPKSH